jgi:hypothetical protein
MAIMSSSKLSVSIKSINGNSTKLRDAIQEALISCAYYAIKDGNTNPFNDLLKAVGTNTRIKGLALWAETWGCVLVKNESFVINKTARGKMSVSNEQDFEAFEVAMRSELAWYAMVPKEPVKSEFDAEVYINNVLTKLDKEGEVALVEAIKTAVALYNLKQESKVEA